MALKIGRRLTIFTPGLAVLVNPRFHPSDAIFGSQKRTTTRFSPIGAPLWLTRWAVNGGDPNVRSTANLTRASRSCHQRSVGPL
jgi:hypothetical protein